MIKKKCDKVIRIRISSDDLNNLCIFSTTYNMSISKVCRLAIRSLFQSKKTNKKIGG